MTTASNTDQIQAFLASRLSRPRWGEVPSDVRPRTAADGYRLQQKIYDRMEEGGQRRVGYKIGCTAPSSRAPFDLGEPIYAGIFEHTRFDGLERAFATPLVAPSIECEIAFRMETDLPAEAAKDEGAVLAALGEAYAACEVVDSRYGVPPAMIGVPVLLADDFLHAAFVLGKPLKAHLDDLRHPSARLEIGGRVHEAPVPEALPPLSAVSWLARKLGENGARLRAGEIVMTGSLLEPVSIAYRGQEISIAIRGVGVLRSSPAVPGST